LYNWSGLLEYEGDLIEGVRNGAAKEYQAGQLVWEGEFEDGAKIVKIDVIDLF
jgi:antitoxin component YwqK of YwqJK toxin-antitoxin module